MSLMNHMYVPVTISTSLSLYCLIGANKSLWAIVHAIVVITLHSEFVEFQKMIIM